MGCPLYDSGSGFVPDELGEDSPRPPRGAVGFLAEAPGESEVWQRRPLVGRTGKFFESAILAPYGLRRSQCYLGNVIRCRPHNNVFPASHAAVTHCRRYDSVLLGFAPDIAILTYHPAAAFRNRSVFPLIRASVLKAVTLSWRGYRVLVAMGEHACRLVFPESGRGGLRHWHNHIVRFDRAGSGQKG